MSRNENDLWPRLLILLIPLLLGTMACNLTNQMQATPAITATSPYGVPTVRITSPLPGSEVVVGDEVLVIAAASDAIGVTRTEMRVNGFIVSTIPSASQNGETTFSTIHTWRTTEAGPAIIEVVAYRQNTASLAAQVTINVRQSAYQVTATVAPPAEITPIPTDDPTCRARVEVTGLNFRTGPETNYPIIRVLPLGSVVQIVGRLHNNTWWQVRDDFLNIGWISAGYTTQLGDCSLVPSVAAPPSPTPLPATAFPTSIPTSTPLPAPTSLPIPDLIISEIIGPSILQLNTIGSVGVRYTVRITNQGTAQTGSFTTSFQHPDGTIEQLPIVVNLLPGQSVDLPVDVTFIASDAYTLIAIADSGLNVTEADKNNNVTTLNVIVTNPPM